MEMKNNSNNNQKDKCVICGKETKYDINEHIDNRYGYVQGVGQVCYECFKTIDDMNFK